MWRVQRASISHGHEVIGLDVPALGKKGPDINLFQKNDLRHLMVIMPWNFAYGDVF